MEESLYEIAQSIGLNPKGGASIGRLLARVMQQHQRSCSPESLVPMHLYLGTVGFRLTASQIDAFYLEWGRGISLLNDAVKELRLAVYLKYLDKQKERDHRNAAAWKYVFANTLCTLTVDALLRNAWADRCGVSRFLLVQIRAHLQTHFSSLDEISAGALSVQELRGFFDLKNSVHQQMHQELLRMLEPLMFSHPDKILN